MKKATNDLLSQIVKAIVSEVESEQIYLFGLRARGDAKAESDLDLLMVESEPFGRRRSRFFEINRIYDALSAFHVPEDILLYSADEFAKWRNSLNHAIGRCYREGKFLYARS